MSGVLMKKISTPQKAYKNLDFLNSPQARTIRMLAEFYEPQSRFQKNKITDTVVFFGSARIKSKKEAEENLEKVKKEALKPTSKSKEMIASAEKALYMSKYYEEAVELSAKLTKWSAELKSEYKRFVVCSGGGPGIMEAANKGAAQAGGSSIGLNISLPFEQFVNKYVKPENAFEFHYFFMRKLWFVDLAKALVTFPGGFGTLDELMEVLTLRQTGKIKKHMKVIIYGKEYWNKIINFDALMEQGMIDKTDFQLFDFCDTVDEAFEKITSHFLKYHYKK